MATYTIRPGDSVPSLQPGDTLNLTAGVFGPLRIPGVPRLKVLGADRIATVIRGGRSQGGEDAAGLRVVDGADDIDIGNLTLEMSPGRGLFLTAAARAHVHDIESRQHGIEAIHIADCPDAVMEDLHLHHSRDTGATSADRRHALYIAGDMSGSVTRRLLAHDVSGSGFQANAASHDTRMSRILMEECDFARCGGDGTPTISLLAVNDSIFRRFREQEPRVSWWVVLFDDGQGSSFGCYRNRFEDFTVPDGSEVHEEVGGQNVYAPGAGWSPGDTPQPPDPPRPPIDPKPAILADAQKQSAAIRAALENKTARRIRAAALVPLNLLDADLAALSR